MPAHRKPTNLLEFSGAFAKNPQRRRERELEPKFVAGLSEPPDFLDADAQEEWRRVVPDLEAAGVTARVEAMAMATYCIAVSHLQKAQAEIARDGITIQTDAGLKKHPAMNIIKDASQVIKCFTAEFGMTPASRSKVKAQPTSNEKPKSGFAAV